MARTQAADYERRRQKIVERAADLFADRGFLGTSIADLAHACKTSKSLIYHYYATKEDILFDVMYSHVRALLDRAEQIAAGPGDAGEKMSLLTHDFMQLYLGASARQRVLLNDLVHLPKRRRTVVVNIQRRLIGIVAQTIAELRPELSVRNSLSTPAAMLYFGMINWMHTWLDPEGRARPARIAALAADVFLEGIEKAQIPPLSAR